MRFSLPALGCVFSILLASAVQAQYGGFGGAGPGGYSPPSPGGYNSGPSIPSAPSIPGPPTIPSSGGYGPGGFGPGATGSDPFTPGSTGPGTYGGADPFSRPNTPPDYTTPAYSPPSYSPPRYTPPSYTPPSMLYEEYKYCTSCNKEVADSASVGQRCPHCGVLWTSDDSSPFSPRSSSRTSTPLNISARNVGRLVGLAVMLVIGACGGLGALFAATRKSANSRPNGPFPPNYYPPPPGSPFQR